MNRTKSSAIAVSQALSVLIAACGGGGGGSIDSPPAAPASQSTTTQGAITGFGSIFVNSVEFDVSSAQVQIDDNASRADALRIGQIVTVSGRRDSSVRGTATRVVYQPELRGAISSIDTANSRFIVLGQTIVTGASTVFRNVADFSG